MEIAPVLPEAGQSGVHNAALIWRALPWVVLLALVALCGWLLIVPVEALFVRIPINYDEGWNAIHTQRLMSGGALYPPVASGITINYPPLSFYVIGGLGKLVGDYVFAGRVVALISQAVVAVNVALVAERIGAGRLFALFAAVSFVLFTAIYFPDYVAVDDPQWLGHALQTSALVLLLRNEPAPSSRQLGVIVLLLLLGGLTKQSLVALPLAATLWIALRDRRFLAAWLGWCAAGLALAVAAAYAGYGWTIFDQVIANPRNLTDYTLLWMAGHILPRLLPFILFAIGGFVLLRNEPRVQLVGIYAVIAAITGIALMSAQGVIYNALFDLVIAIMPLAALLGQFIEDRLTGRSWARAVAALVLALPFLVVAPHARDLYKDEITDLAEVSAWNTTIDQIGRASGPVICKELSLCYWAGRQSAVEFFNFGQRAIRDPALADALAQRLARGDFALIQEDDPIGDSRLPGLINGTIDKYYRILTTTPTVLRVPAAPISPTP